MIQITIYVKSFQSLPKISKSSRKYTMSHTQIFEKDSLLQLIRQTLSEDEYKEKFASFIFSAIFENEGAHFMNCEKRKVLTKEESTQTEIPTEKSSFIFENCTENICLDVEPNNENIVSVVSRDGCSPTQIPRNLQHYSFDPYCSRFLPEDENAFWDEPRKRSRTRSSSSSKSRSRSTTRTRSPSANAGRRRASRSRSRSLRRRRRASPSFMESRRITSARRMPVPYTRTRPGRERGGRRGNYY